MSTGAFTLADVDQPKGQFTAADVDTTPAGRSVVDSAKDFASAFWDKVNPIAGIKGAAQLTAHPVDTFKSDASARQKVYEEAESSFKSGDYTKGAAKLLYSAIPLMGPQLNDAANDFLQGNYAKGAGASTGMGVALAGPEAIKGAAMSLPGASTAADLSKRMYQSALKPPPGSYSQPEVQTMVGTGIRNEIPVSAAGRAKLGDLVDDLNKNVSAQIQAGAQNGATVNKYAVASRLSDTARKFSNQVTPLSDLANVSDTGNEFLANHPTEIPVNDAQQLKSGTYQQLKSRAFGELKSATVESQKALARGIKEELQTQFPEIQGLNAEEGKLINLDGALERAVNRTSNHDIFSLGGKMATGAGAVIGAAAGGGAGAGIGAAGATVLHYVLSDPMVQSKLAIALHQASKGTVTIPAAAARVAGYADALGNASGGTASSDDQGARQ